MLNSNPKANDCYYTNCGAIIAVYEDKPGVFAYNVYDTLGQMDGYCSGFKSPDIEKDGILKSVENDLGEKIIKFLGNYESVAECIVENDLYPTDKEFCETHATPELNALIASKEATNFASLVEEAQNNTHTASPHTSQKNEPER